ncbi:MAG TPA: glycosyltransferase family 4 protein [Thermomicrobiales bacterium]|nr:glycosyltransferase family 4 protein [Thermomicrobiales bacterium]
MRVYYLARNLVERGCKVSIISSSFFHKYFSAPSVSGLRRHDVIDGIDYVWVRTPSYRGRGLGQIINQLAYTIGATLADKDLGAPDVVIASSPHPFASLPAYRLAKRSGAGFIYEVRDLWPLILQQLSGLSHRNPYIRMLKWAEAFSVARADRIVSVKPGDWEYFAEEYGVHPSRVLHIPNGFDIGHIVEEPFSLRNDLQIDEGEFVVGYAGAVSAYYGMRDVVDAAIHLRDLDSTARIVIVGGGSDLSNLKSKAHELQLDNVHFVGQMPKKYMLSIVREFDVGLVSLRNVPANRYGVSTNKLYEYMYAGLPVLAYYETEYDPVQEVECGVTVKPSDPHALAEAIVRLERLSKGELSRMGSNARKAVEQRYSYDVISSAYLGCILELSGVGNQEAFAVPATA